MAEYDSALAAISDKLDTLHVDAGNLYSALGDMAAADSDVDLSGLDTVAELLGYTDLLLLVLCVLVVLFAGLFVGYIVTERLR